MKKNKIISIRIDDDLFKHLQNESLIHDRSISYIANKHIKNDLRKEDTKNEKH